MVSLTLPSRQRLASLQALVSSVFDTADNPDEVEVIVYDDNDPTDNTYQQWAPPKNVKIYRTKHRQTLSHYWQLAYEKSQGPIYMLCNDDVLFHTKGWDTKVKEAFDKYPDKIVLIYGEDGDPNKEKNFGALPFVHQNWIDAVGYFTVPYFSGDFVDTWLNDVADGIDRKLKIKIYTEHLHPAFGKGEMDETRSSRWKKHWKDDMPGLYLSKADERKTDIEKLKKAIANA